jgi:hypothetical protein
MNPMSTFQAAEGEQVHDVLNEEWITLDRAQAAEFWTYAHSHGEHISWDGLILDGWLPTGVQPPVEPEAAPDGDQR